MIQNVLRYLPGALRDRIQLRPGLIRILDNIGWLFFDKFLRMAVGLVVFAWLARYLGPDQFGLYNYALAFAALFASFASLGLNNIVIREIVLSQADVEEILGTTFVLKFLAGMATFSLTTLAIYFIRPDDTLCFWMVTIIAAGTIFNAFDAIDLWFQSQVLSKYTVYAKNIVFLIISIVKVALILSQAPLISFAWASLAEIVIGAMGLAMVYHVNGNHIINWKISFVRAGKLLNDSWPLFFSGIVIMIYMRIDQVMIGQMAGIEEVGFYSAAVRLTEAWYFIPMAVIASVFPGIVTARASSEELFYQRLQKIYNIMAFLAYAVAIPITFIADDVIVLLFGGEYRNAGPMLTGLIWTCMFANLGVARAAFLTTMNWTRTHFLASFSGCVINVALNYLLIPVYGGMGAVVASLISYWFSAHATCFFYKPLHKTGQMLFRALIYPKIW
jgi:O-antigen/teichoic acid export membrane protein